MNAALIVSAIIMLVIELSGAAASSDSKIQQQNHSFIALLTGNNVIPPVSTNASGIVKFQANASNINELYYEIKLTNLHNDVARVDVNLGNKTENGRSVYPCLQKFVADQLLQNLKGVNSSSTVPFLLKT